MKTNVQSVRQCSYKRRVDIELESPLPAIVMYHPSQYSISILAHDMPAANRSTGTDLACSILKHKCDCSRAVIKGLIKAMFFCAISAFAIPY